MILVTGGTGLVGSHLLYELINQNKELRAIYRRPHKLEIVKKVFSYYSSDGEDLFNKIDWVEANLNDIPSLKTAFTDIDYVYHCAAFVSFEPDRYQQLRKINIEGTANIVNLCISNNIKKLCYVSSVAAIGNEDDETQFIDEQTKWNPEADNSVYAITKYGAEMEVWRGTQEGIDAVIVNPGIIIGPGFWRGGGSSAIFSRIYKGLKYYSPGSSGYVGIRDVINIMVTLMERDLKNERYILVSENWSFKKFIEQVSKALGVPAPKKQISNFKLSLAWRLDWLNRKLFGNRRKLPRQMAKSLSSQSIFNNEKIKRALDYEFIPLEDSIHKTADLYLRDLEE